MLDVRTSRYHMPARMQIKAQEGLVRLGFIHLPLPEYYAGFKSTASWF